MMPGSWSKVLLTGATGFIGTHLVKRMVISGYDLTAFMLPGEDSLLSPGVKPINGDIADSAAVFSAVQASQPELIIHLASAGVTDPGLSMMESCRVNVAGAIHILEAARNLPAIKRLIMVGSAFEYGSRRSDDLLDPFSAYGASKTAAWAYARAAFNAWGLPVVWVRPFQVYGPGQPAKTLIPCAIQAALNHRDFSMTAGAQQRDFIYIDDLIDGLVATVSAENIEGRTLDIGTGTLTPLLDVIHHIWELTGAQGRILAGALPYRMGEVPALAANVLRTRLLLNWEASVPLLQGLRWTIDDLNNSMQNKTAEAL
ncbi:MAG: NAD(P)-dependent oxidoreductase [Anaerolineae bacterium]|nr:NAD(P)-dependent oxidoreductase [Anaerolineae bacterium]